MQSPEGSRAIVGPFAPIPSRCHLNDATGSYRLPAQLTGDFKMKGFLTSAAVIVGLLLTSPVCAQSKAKAQNVPEISFE